MIALDIDIIDIWQDETDWEKLAGRAIHAAAAQTPYAALASCPMQCGISIILSDDETLHMLNRQYRQKDRPTNVLSFPMADAGQIAEITRAPEGEAMLGDMAIAREICAKEAQDKAISVEQHAAHLIVHGTLHLLGYDHIDDTEADAMEALEIKALASMGLPNPYIGDNLQQ